MFLFKIICNNCHYSSSSFDIFWDLSLSVPTKYIRFPEKSCNIEECIRIFGESEILEGDEKFFCRECKNLQTATKYLKISKFPKILVIQLKRFSYTMEGKKTKIDNKIFYPELISLESLKGDCVERSKGAKFSYKLISSCIHISSINIIS